VQTSRLHTHTPKEAKMRFATWTITLFLLAISSSLAAPRPFAAQTPDAPSRPALTIGAFAGLGSGPVDAASWGLAVTSPSWRRLDLRAEYSGWGNGLGGIMCPQSIPESHRCSVSGRAFLVGLGASLPIVHRVAIFAEATSGRFTRNWLGDDKVTSPALSLEAGARIHLVRGLAARLGGRSLHVYDSGYRTLLGEKLRYTMGTFGLEYGFGR
jgi:hypothetical protein